MGTLGTIWGQSANDTVKVVLYEFGGMHSECGCASRILRRFHYSTSTALGQDTPCPPATPHSPRTTILLLVVVFLSLLVVHFLPATSLLFPPRRTPI
eukprot:7399492-Pyramimonas_sp.AAC.1